MANSSILGGAATPTHPPGTDVDALGPSDSSDSGSDVQTDQGRSAMPDGSSEGALPIAHESTTDAAGTGERAAAHGRDINAGADVSPDRIDALPADAPDDVASIDDSGAASVDELAVEEGDDDNPEAA